MISLEVWSSREEGEGQSVKIKVSGEYSPDVLDDMTRRATQLLQEFNQEELDEIEALDDIDDLGARVEGSDE